MAVSKRTRYEVLRRDAYTCRYCRSVDNPITVDHVVPVALGGSDDPSNLVAACRDCNAGKSSSTPDETTVADVSDDAVRWAAAMRQAARERAKARRPALAYVEKFDAAWVKWTWGRDSHELPRPADWRQSVEAFHTAGLPVDELLEAITIATSNQRVATDACWRYMCGVAWKKLTALQEDAAAIFTRDGR